MKKIWIHDETGSFHNYLPPGCEICRRGASLVLFVTGVCKRGCFYCPISKERMGSDTLFANERQVSNLSDILEEAEAIDALGTGITGGEPLLRLDLVLECIRMLKQHFGEKHHIHLYTGTIPEKGVLSRLRDAGLDEIRVHPDLYHEDTRLEEALRFARDLGMESGVEIPAISPAPWIAKAVCQADGFLNINELEFSETNADMLKARGFSISADSSAAIGCESIARSFMSYDIKLHYCTSLFKDAVQLRERLKRRAKKTKRSFDILSEDGTILVGTITAPDLWEAVRILSDLGVPESMYAIGSGEIEIAAWILEDIAEEIKRSGCDTYIVERYPTESRLVVERIPL